MDGDGGGGVGFDWRRLVDGPHGRRFLLDCAVAVEAQRRGLGAGRLGKAAFRLVGVESPGQASFTAVLRLGGVESPGQDSLSDTDGPHGTPSHRIDELREALRATTPGPVPSEQLPDLLQWTVAQARYWQAPEYLDLLLQDPELQALLEPWATVVGEDRSTGWWTTPIARDDQWLVTRSGPFPEPDWSGTDMHRVLGEWSRDEKTAEAQAVVAQGPSPRETHTGRWWSITGDVAMTTRRWPGGRSRTIDWIDNQPVRQSVHDPVAVLLEEDWVPDDDATWRQVWVPDDVRVLEIDSAQAWCDLCRSHPLEVSATRRDDWWRTTGRDGRWVIPDWSSVATEWDGVHLPLANYLELAGRPLPVDAETCTLIAGWTPDSTRWLTGPPTL